MCVFVCVCVHACVRACVCACVCVVVTRVDNHVVLYLLSGSHDRSINIWDVKMGRLERTLENMEEQMESIFYCCNDMYLLTMAQKSICVIKVSTKKKFP